MDVIAHQAIREAPPPLPNNDTPQLSEINGEVTIVEKDRLTVVPTSPNVMNTTSQLLS
jgi:hypothetical protein